MLFSYAIFVSAAAFTIFSVNADNEKKTSQCREPSIVQNFNLTRWLGNWYLYSRHNHAFESGCDCFTSEVTSIDDASIEISNCCQMLHVSNETQSCNVSVNYARLKDAEKKEGDFWYTRAGVDVESHLWIVDTDYETYGIINGCDRPSDKEEHEVFWILSRNREIDAATVRKIREVLTSHNFERNKIIRQRHGVDVCRTNRPHRGRGNHSRGHRRHDAGEHRQHGDEGHRRHGQGEHRQHDDEGYGRHGGGEHRQHGDEGHHRHGGGDHRRHSEGEHHRHNGRGEHGPHGDYNRDEEAQS